MANNRNFALSIIGSFGLACLAQPAFAQQQEIIVTGQAKMPKGHEAVKKVVNIGDLDLAKPGDAEMMEKRVRATISEICALPARPAQWQINDSKTCTDFAWASARPQMNAALERARGK